MLTFKKCSTKCSILFTISLIWFQLQISAQQEAAARIALERERLAAHGAGSRPPSHLHWCHVTVMWSSHVMGEKDKQSDRDILSWLLVQCFDRRNKMRPSFRWFWSGFVSAIYTHRHLCLVRLKGYKLWWEAVVTQACSEVWIICSMVCVKTRFDIKWLLSGTIREIHGDVLPLSSKKCFVKNMTLCA